LKISKKRKISGKKAEAEKRRKRKQNGSGIGTGKVDKLGNPSNAKPKPTICFYWTKKGKFTGQIGLLYWTKNTGHILIFYETKRQKLLNAKSEPYN
jgi:hypothetical protein